jgi:hypothetical protein
MGISKRKIVFFSALLHQNYSCVKNAKKFQIKTNVKKLIYKFVFLSYKLPLFALHGGMKKLSA